MFIRLFSKANKISLYLDSKIENKKMRKSIRITIIGRVQGVGYRYFVLNSAKSLNIYGFVKNEINGSVTVEAEGDETELEFFLSLLKQGTTFSYVESVEPQYQPLQNFGDFIIKS
jgi:acylphosphatase